MLTNICLENPPTFLCLFEVGFSLSFGQMSNEQSSWKSLFASLCHCGFLEVFKCANHTPFLLVTPKCVTYLTRERVRARLGPVEFLSQTIVTSAQRSRSFSLCGLRQWRLHNEWLPVLIFATHSIRSVL